MKGVFLLNRRRVPAAILALLCVLAVLPATAAANMDVVYCDPWAGSPSGSGEEHSPVASLQAAIDLAEPGGTVYLMNSVTVQRTLVIDGKGVTVKARSNNLPLINVQKGGNLTLQNITLDGGNYSSTYDFDMVQVSGTAELGPGTVLQNFSTPNYGTALAVYTPGQVTLKGAAIQNNHCGKINGSYTGGVYVSGTLLVDGDSSITGNTWYDNTTASDISIFGNGRVELDGSAGVGTIVLHNTSANAKISLTSPLAGPIKFRNDNVFGGRLLLPDLREGQAIADGAGGYELAEADVQKMNIPSYPEFFTLKKENGQAVVDRASHTITLDPGAEHAVELVAAPSVKVYEDAVFQIKAKPGYKLTSFSVHDKANPHSMLGCAPTGNPGEYTFTMNKFDVMISPTYELLPGTPPAITADLPPFLVVEEGSPLTLQATAEATGTLTYQWYKEGAQLGGPSGGPSFTIPAAVKGDAGKYHVAVTSTEATGVTASVDSGDCQVLVVEKAFTIEHPQDLEAGVLDKAAVWPAVLTKEDVTSMASGEDANILLKITGVEAPPEAPAILNALGGRQLGRYLDVSLLKTIGIKPTIRLRETTDPIRMTLEIPADLQAPGRGRVFSLMSAYQLDEAAAMGTLNDIRLREKTAATRMTLPAPNRGRVVPLMGASQLSGAIVTEVLADLDNDDTTITVDSNRFSTFAILYVDDVTPTPGYGHSGSSVYVVPTPSPTPTPTPKAPPKTGDGGASAWALTVALLAVFLGLAASFLWRHRES